MKFKSARNTTAPRDSEWHRPSGAQLGVPGRVPGPPVPPPRCRPVLSPHLPPLVQHAPGRRGTRTPPPLTCGWTRWTGSWNSVGGGEGDLPGLLPSTPAIPMIPRAIGRLHAKSLGFLFLRQAPSNRDLTIPSCERAAAPGLHAAPPGAHRL